MRHLKVFFICFILLVYNFSPASGQYFSGGQDPAFIRWNQITTNNYQVIYPKDFYKEAAQLASILDWVYEYNSYSLNHKHKKISVILHTHSTEANAFVTWAPKRTEFYTIPSQDIYPQDWLTQLAIHEIRHVVQIDKLRQGFTKILSLILGEQGVGAIAGLFLPLWFLEGDAVAMETALSKTGRGRLPSFEMPVKAMTLEKGIYSYEKSIFGSYKDFVPNHYHIGYLMVAYGRQKYGAKLWEYSIDNVATRPYTLTPFSNGIKKITNKNKWQFYRQAIHSYDSIWNGTLTNNLYIEYPVPAFQVSKVFTSYRFPQYINDSTIVAEKSGLGDFKKFVQLSQSRETHLFTPGNYNLNRISANGRFLAWNENLYHPRWENYLGSKIVLLNLITNERRRVAIDRNLFSPSFSSDSKKLICVKSTVDNRFSLISIHIATEAIEKEIPLPNNELPINPIWSSQDSSIVSICLGEKGKGMVSINYLTGKLDTLIPYSPLEISQPVEYKSYILFHGTYNGQDNIFAVSKANKRLYQVTHSKYGAFDPAISPNQKKLAFSNYTADGFKVVEATLDTSKFNGIEQMFSSYQKMADVISRQELKEIDLTSDTILKSVKPYSKIKHLFNFHSWAPSYIDVNSYTLNPGAVLLSQNKLSTAFTTLGYRYDMNERVGRVEAGFAYLGFYPSITLSASKGERASTYLDSTRVLREFGWKETRLNIQIQQPLNLTTGKYFSGITPGLEIKKNFISHDESTPSFYFKGQQEIVQGNLYFYRQLKRSPRDMRPKWGQILDLNFGNTYLNYKFFRSFVNISTIFYTPGLLKHHSSRVSLGYELLPQGRYNNYSALLYPRGYIRQLNSDLKKVSFDYKFPLLYPDLKFGPIIYLQRVKLNLFVDYALGNYLQKTRKYQSMGFELTNDLHLANFPVPLDLGFRYIFLPSVLDSKLELLLSVRFNDL